MTEHRADPRAVVLAYLAPLMFGVHSTLLPWMANQTDSDEVWSFWELGARRSLQSTSVDTWALGVVLLGLVVAVVCGFRAFLPEAPRSLAAAVPAVLLAVCAAAIPFVMQARFAADYRGSDDPELVVRWGGPATLVLAALWVAGTCAVGRRTWPEGSTGWARPKVTGWSERGM